jgi:copper chaperone CopZ
MVKKTLKIQGMHCAACGANVTKSLTKLGAKDVNVNVIFGKAFANVDNSITDEQLKKAVEKVGFELTDIETE